MTHIKTLSILFILLLSCNAKKVSEAEAVQLSIEGCPEAGRCDVERFENSKISMYEDTTGQFYTKIEGAENTNLYKITYSRKVDERIADANYSEVIYFEMENDKKSQKLNDQNLVEANLIYGRFCYCPGQTSYVAILSGSLDFKKKKNQTEIKLEIQPKNFPIKMDSLSIKGKIPQNLE